MAQGQTLNKDAPAVDLFSQQSHMVRDKDAKKFCERSSSCSELHPLVATDLRNLNTF